MHVRLSSTMILWWGTIRSVCIECGAKAATAPRTFFTTPLDKHNICHRRTDSEQQTSVSIGKWGTQDRLSHCSNGDWKLSFSSVVMHPTVPIYGRYCLAMHENYWCYVTLQLFALRHVNCRSFLLTYLHAPSANSPSSPGKTFLQMSRPLSRNSLRLVADNIFFILVVTSCWTGSNLSAKKL